MVSYNVLSKKWSELDTNLGPYLSKYLSQLNNTYVFTHKFRMFLKIISTNLDLSLHYFLLNF